MSSIINYQYLMSRKNIKCSNCKYSKTKTNNKKVCYYFKFNDVINDDSNKVYVADADYCRDREFLCGPYAKYFEEDK